ncbi:MAG: hypothetical protein WD489_05685, partial [Rhodovibrionaceae bacterium]
PTAKPRARDRVFRPGIPLGDLKVDIKLSPSLPVSEIASGQPAGCATEALEPEREKSELDCGGEIKKPVSTFEWDGLRTHPL